MLNQAPIFMGGQGGLVGPCRLAYGITVAAGTIVRKDELRENRLIFGGAPKNGNIAYSPGEYSNVRRIFDHNVNYIANLVALYQWYRHVRTCFIGDEFPEELCQGLMDTLALALAERLKRLEEFIQKASVNLSSQEKQSAYVQKIVDRWPEIRERMEQFRRGARDNPQKDAFISIIEKIPATEKSDYITAIRNLSKNDKQTGTTWLQGVVDQVNGEINGIVDK